jgi:hypothetical protein
MGIRVDGDEIRIQLPNVESCDDILSNLDSFGIVIGELVQNRKNSLILMGENHSKYAEWWNTKIVPQLLSMSLSDDDVWKWNQLVRQELDMWIRLNRPVGIDEVTWLSDRRGFSPTQTMVLIEGLKVVGLYTYSNTIIPNDTLDKMNEKEVDQLAMQVGL